MILKDSILFCILIFVINVCAITEAKSASFQKAFYEASNYAIQFDDPASVQKGINLYYSAIESFPDDPNVHKAKLALFDILRSEGSEEKLSLASDIIQDLSNEADMSSVAGRNITIKFIDFHIEDARGKAFQDIGKAKVVLQKLYEQIDTTKHSKLFLKIASRKAKILVLEDNEIDSLKVSIDAIKESIRWGYDGFWGKLSKENPKEYNDYMEQLSAIESATTWAIARSDNPETSNLLRKEPLILMQYEHIRKAWEKFEMEYFLGSQDEFEKLQEQLFKDVMASDIALTEKQKAAGSDSKNVIVNVSLDSKEEPSQEENKPEAEVREGTQEEVAEKANPEETISRNNKAWYLAGIAAALAVIIVFVIKMPRKKD